MAIQDIYPTALRLLGRPVLVVGGGPVAARRAKGLLDAGAQVTVVAPLACPALTGLADAGLLAWEPRTYRSGDVDGVWFVQSATGDAAVDAQVSADAEAQRIWCVNASDHEASAAWTPAVASMRWTAGALLNQALTGGLKGIDPASSGGRLPSTAM